MPHDGLSLVDGHRHRRHRRDSFHNIFALLWQKSVRRVRIVCDALWRAGFLYGLVSCWFIYLLKTEYIYFILFFVHSNVHFIWHRLCARFRRVFLFFFIYLFFSASSSSLSFCFFFCLVWLPLCPCARARISSFPSHASLLVRNFVSSSYLPTTLKAH